MAGMEGTTSPIREPVDAPYENVSECVSSVDQSG